MVGIFESTYYGPTQKNFCSYFLSSMTHRYMHANIADICTFSHKWCASKIEVLKLFPNALNPNTCRKRDTKLRFASMQRPKAYLSCDTEIRFFE